ncbi:MAG: phosphonoacetaldehyde hydrolase [Candidatus Adiutrix sp.]|jgi:phosphonoacetaldehyde hydrolase|nr:phosphonoacetaldehyde hydrolase [Candidatus Adiutrix sp.]
MKPKIIVLDWAGTTVDFGSFAPVAAVMRAFEDFGLRPTLEETRAPMGLAKRTHLALMLSGERLAAAWAEKYGRSPGEAEIDRVYARFEPALKAVLGEHADLLPGVAETTARLRASGFKIGSTTGYSRAMMDMVVPAARAAGYAPDVLACPDEVGGLGRPYPYMLWRALEKLGAESIAGVVKVGDTLADIAEGLNAGCLSLGVIAGSSLLGLTRAELEALPESEKKTRYEGVRAQYLAAGASGVLDDFTELPGWLDAFHER